MFTAMDRHHIPWRIANRARANAQARDLERLLRRPPSELPPVDFNKWIPALRKKMGHASSMEFSRMGKLSAVIDCARESGNRYLNATQMQGFVRGLGLRSNYRQAAAVIKDSKGQITDREFPPPHAIAELMDEYQLWLKHNAEAGDHPFLSALGSEVILLSIHPFEDGNGRLARLAETWLAQPALVSSTNHFCPELMIHLYFLQYVEKLLQCRRQQTLDPYLNFFLPRYFEFLAGGCRVA